jgi:hypothetical protein
MVCTAASTSPYQRLVAQMGTTRLPSTVPTPLAIGFNGNVDMMLEGRHVRAADGYGRTAENSEDGAESRDDGRKESLKGQHS